MKKKTAKQIFKDLGYGIAVDDEYQITYINIKENCEITFWYEDLDISFGPILKVKSNNIKYQKDNDQFISMPLLHAIIQQCKELEWA